MRFAVAAVCAALGAFAMSGPAVAATPWSGSGTGTTNVVSDGTSSAPEFTYSYSNPCHCGASGSWTFSTTSDVSGSVDLAWSYTGFNAYYAVTVGLSAFVTHLGVTTTTPLVSAGPTNCCSSPSSGFSYSGATTLAVAVGDTYGFTMRGSNDDSNSQLNGTLTATVTESPDPDPVVDPAQPQRGGYCAVAGNVDPDTGQPIAPGTFLNLEEGQPSSDPDYAGATPAIEIAGEGITCNPPPTGYVEDGSQDGYAYYDLPPRTGYCAVAGDVNPITDQPIPPGSFLDLLTNQPETDPHYTGATPAVDIEGTGATCDPVPAGYVQDGYVGLNPYYQP